MKTGKILKILRKVAYIHTCLDGHLCTIALRLTCQGVRCLHFNLLFLALCETLLNVTTAFYHLMFEKYLLIKWEWGGGQKYRIILNLPKLQGTNIVNSGL